MTKRERINKKIKDNLSKISELKKQNVELTRQDWLLSDKTQWFTEKEETTGKGKNKETNLIGRIHWMQAFKDEDKPDNPVWIERSQIVRINGEWWNNYPFSKH